MTTREAEIERMAVRWIVGAHTGLSSKTIWAVMMGVPCEHPSAPYDRDDSWRCARLLAFIPEWRARLDEVPVAYPHRLWAWGIAELKDEAWCARLLATHWRTYEPTPALADDHAQRA